MLGEAAVARGFRQLVAFYFVDNRDVEGLVKACGLPYRSQVSQGVVEVQLVLPQQCRWGQKQALNRRRRARRSSRRSARRRRFA